MSDAPDRSGFDPTDRASYATWTRDVVRYRDLDPNGHVNNGAINEFFEDGRVHFRRERMAALGDAVLTGFAVARFAATYRAPLRHPATVEIGTVVTRIGTSSFTLGQGVFVEARCIATAEVVSVFIDHETGKSRPLTEAVRAALEGALWQPPAGG